MNNLNVCLLPFHITWEDKEANLQTLERILESLHPDTDLLVLPETFSTGFPAGDKEHIRPMAERNTGATMDFIKELAARHNVAIAGSFIADSGGLLFNRAFFIEPGGEETFADKRHLFTMAGEDKSFSRGHDRLKVRFRGWEIAMVVCYDIRFPVWCRNRGNEYDLLLAVANWPKVRVDAWNKLLVARAIENEAYVCGVDCQGTDLNGFEYDGSTMAIDFKGKPMATFQTGCLPQPDGTPATGGTEACTRPEFVYATLSMDKLQRFREKFPAWRDADAFSIEE